MNSTTISLRAAETDLVAAVAACESIKPDVALLDLSYPGDAAIKAGATLIRRGLITAVAFLDNDRDAARAKRALNVSRSGYFTRGEDIYDICNGLRALLPSEIRQSPAIALRNVAELPTVDPSSHMKPAIASEGGLTPHPWSHVERAHLTRASRKQR